MMQPLEMKLLVTVILVGILVSIATCICLSVFYQLCIQDSSLRIDITYRNLTMLTMIFCTFSSIGDFIHLTIKLLDFPFREVEDDPETILEIAIVAIYFIATILFYTLIVHRIYKPFKLNKCLCYCLFGLILISAIFSGLYCHLFWLEYDAFDKEVKYVLFPLSISDLILNISIMLIFVYKMRSTIININITMSDRTENQVNLIANAIVKHSVLFGIAIITNQGYYISMFYDTMSGDYRDIVVNYCLPYSLRTLESFTNIIVLWLVLPISYDKYICICKYCHLGAFKCCMRNRTVSLNNPYHQLEEL
eukprot:423152_1